MSDAVRALVFADETTMTVEQVLLPCAPGDVIVEVIAAGICGSDIHGFAGETGRRTVGMVMGHEVVGVVSSVGTGVQNWQAGDQVCVNPVIGCRQCSACLAGLTNRCPRRKVLGVAPDLVGAFAERICVPATNLVPFQPEGDVGPNFGSLVEPLAVGLNAARQAGIRPGDSVAVIGLGMIGLACVWAALREGAARVFAADLDQSRATLLSELLPGEPIVAVDPRQTSIIDATRAVYPDGLDVAIDAVGMSSTCRDALSAVRAGGTVALVGMGAPQLELSAYELTANEKRLVGCFCYSEQTFAECAHAVASGQVDPAVFVDTVVAMTDAPAVFAELASGRRTSVKTLILPQA
jgi:threonine dehydrogenase-like Zn-dependent dehydrogenase